jgi:hypothetical protein
MRRCNLRIAFRDLNLRDRRIIARRWFPATLLLLGGFWPLVGVAAFPEFKNQNSKTTFLHSAMMTSDPVQRDVPDGMGGTVKIWVPGGLFTDTRFAKLVSDSVAPRINEIAYDFNQCNGGGMIDELLTEVPQPVASYTSAARHDQTAWAGALDSASGIDPLFPYARRVEGFYNLHYAPAAGGATPMTQRDAAKSGYENDFFGPHKEMHENPQYTSNGAMGDDIRLHRQNPNNPVKSDQYLAILYGGSTSLDLGFSLPTIPPIPPALPIPIPGAWGVNWNTLNRTRDSLLAAGYTDDDMYILYPSFINPQTGMKFAVQPNGQPLPAWVDGDTTSAELKSAFDTWLKPKVTPQTQLFFWSSWGHGVEIFDWVGWLFNRAGNLLNGVNLSVETDRDFAERLRTVFNHYNPGVVEGAAGTPLVEVTTSQFVSNLEVYLAGASQPLTLHDSIDVSGNGSEYQNYFALSRSDMEALLANCTPTACSIDLKISVPSLAPGFNLSNLIVQMGPTLGDFANGLAMAPVPEPATSAMVGLYLLVLQCSRWRKSRA